eukprot:2468210-Pleurochrysis_carterae.AAC.2
MLCAAQASTTVLRIGVLDAGAEVAYDTILVGVRRHGPTERTARSECRATHDLMRLPLYFCRFLSTRRSIKQVGAAASDCLTSAQKVSALCGPVPPAGKLRPGYRSVQLRHPSTGTRIDLCSIFVHIEIGRESNVFAEAGEEIIALRHKLVQQEMLLNALRACTKASECMSSATSAPAERSASPQQASAHE